MPRVLVSLILFALTILIAIFFLWPNYLKFQNLQAQIENKEQDLKNREEYYKELASLSEQLKEYQEELSKIDFTLSTDPSLISLLRFFQKAASENGLILKSIGNFSTKSLTENPGIKETTLSSLKLAGSYSSLKSFLITLEKNSRIIEVDSISFSAPKEGEIFDFELSIKTYSH